MGIDAPTRLQRSSSALEDVNFFDTSLLAIFSALLVALIMFSVQRLHHKVAVENAASLQKAAIDSKFTDKQTETSKVKKPNLMFLDLLKIVGISMIILQHLSTIPNPYYNWFYFSIDLLGIYRLSWGALGVTLFLAASGFSLAYTYNHLTSWRDLKRFYGKRLLRIYPAYWIAGILFTIILFPEWLNQPHSALEVVQLATGTQSFGVTTYSQLFGNSNNFNGPLWFITVILSMYLFFPLLLYVFNRHPNYSLIGVAAISVISNYLLLAGSTDYAFAAWFPLCKIFEFSIGIYLVKADYFPKTVSNKLTSYLGSISFFIFLINIPLMTKVGSNMWLYFLALIVVSTALWKLDEGQKTALKHFSWLPHKIRD